MRGLPASESSATAPARRQVAVAQAANFIADSRAAVPGDESRRAAACSGVSARGADGPWSSPRPRSRPGPRRACAPPACGRARSSAPAASFAAWPVRTGALDHQRCPRRCWRERARPRRCSVSPRPFGTNRSSTSLSCPVRRTAMDESQGAARTRFGKPTSPASGSCTGQGARQHSKGRPHRDDHHRSLSASTASSPPCRSRASSSTG